MLSSLNLKAGSGWAGEQTIPSFVCEKPKDFLFLKRCSLACKILSLFANARVSDFLPGDCFELFRNV